MKIALVTAHYAPHRGGVETHVDRLASEHMRAGHDVTVITQTSGPRIPDVVRLRSVSPWEAIPIGWVSSGRLSLGAFDVVHVHNYHTALFLQSSLLADSRLVLTPHYHGTSSSRLGRSAHRVWSAAAERVWAKAAGVVAVTHQEADLLQRNFPRLSGRVRVIPNGVDPMRPDTGQSQRPGMVLSVGRLVRHKRLDRLVSALALVPNAELHVVGVGPELARLRRMADELEVEARVHFLGSVSEFELARLYGSASALASMSEIEAFGLSVAQALSSGLPVVASDIPAHRELVETGRAHGRSGHLLPADASSDALAAALQSALGTVPCSAGDVFPTWSEVASEVRVCYSSQSSVIDLTQANPSIRDYPNLGV